MKVTCVPVIRECPIEEPERKKVEVCLSRVPCRIKVIKINARVVSDDIDIYDDIAADEYVEEMQAILSSEEPVTEGEISENINISWDDFDEGEETELTDDEGEYELPFELGESDIETDEAPDDDEGGTSLERINALFSELEDDVDDSLSLCDEIPEDDTQDEAEGIPEKEESADTSRILYRHFERDYTGERYESDSAESEGQEVVCLNESGKVVRACGVMKKNNSEQSKYVDDGVYRLAVAQMFGVEETE